MSNERRVLKTGKLPGQLLQSLIEGLPRSDADGRLIIGPGLGEDAAHILYGENTILAKTDPITFTTDRIGWYAVNVNANDIAVAGGTPKWFFATLMMPPGSTEAEVGDIFAQLGEAAFELDVQLAGGHTEVTPAVTQPVICGFMLGEAPTSRTVSASGARPGDAVILTKGIAIEGTAILAKECRDALVSAGVQISDIDDATNLFFHPGISVFKDAQIVVECGGVTAMHDPTEGGLATALQELAFASKVDITIDATAVNILPQSQTICDALNIDPWGLISSGALLATVSPERQDATVEALHESNIDAQVIGTVDPPPDEGGGGAVTTKWDPDSPSQPMPTFERDELARYFDQHLD